MKFVLICALTFSLTSLAYAKADAGTDELVKQKFPGAKVVLSKECEIGKKKQKVTGIVIQKATATSKTAVNAKVAPEIPLEAAIVQVANGKPTLTVLPLQMENSMGSGSNFLYDFWNSEKKMAENLEMRCALPGKDPDIGTDSNGEYKKGFKDQGNHLCFMASTAYNNWACFNSKSPGKFESSFVQMNAD